MSSSGAAEWGQPFFVYTVSSFFTDSLLLSSLRFQSVRKLELSEWKAKQYRHSPSAKLYWLSLGSPPVC